MGKQKVKDFINHSLDWNTVTDLMEKRIAFLVFFGLGTIIILLILSIYAKRQSGMDRLAFQQSMKSLSPVEEFSPWKNNLPDDGSIRRIVIRDNGSAFGYEYALRDTNGYVLRESFMMYGGGCLEGILPLGIVCHTSAENQLFFGMRSLGSFTETECRVVFNKLVLDLAKPSPGKNIEHDIGLQLKYSSKAFMENRLRKSGYDLESVKLVSSYVGRKALDSENNFGDLYGWYILEATKKDTGREDRLEGFAVLHCRDYGFSAENYIRCD